MATVVWIILVAANCLAFTLMGIDKVRARAGRWRIPERTLLLSAACFGALGGMAGMLIFRHKTRHGRFRYGLPAMLVCQAALLIGWMAARG